MASKRGALIVFEGCDRVGKSTQCQLLVSKLHHRGIPTQELHFPDRSTTIGKLINHYLTNKIELDDHSIHLLFSANRWELLSTINNHLAAGTTMVIDRYAYSGVAFTAAKKVASLDWCKGPDRCLPAPDAVFYLYLSSDEARKRSDYGKERYEKTTFQEAVAGVYEQLKDDSWKCINASDSIDDISEHILQETLSIIDSVGSKPVNKLWT
jgi:dTMP kinase